MAGAGRPSATPSAPCGRPPGLERHLLRGPAALQLQHLAHFAPQPLLQGAGRAAGRQLQVGLEVQAGCVQVLGRPGRIRAQVSKTPGDKGGTRR